MKKKNSKVVRYNKWGYIFLIPFTLVYVVFQLIPLFNTIYNSFFENYLSGLKQIGPNFVGLENYKNLFLQGDIWIYAKNTLILWLMCGVLCYFIAKSKGYPDSECFGNAVGGFLGGIIWLIVVMLKKPFDKQAEMEGKSLSAIESLGRLSDMRQRGIISEEEYNMLNELASD